MTAKPLHTGVSEAARAAAASLAARGVQVQRCAPGENGLRLDRDEALGYLGYTGQQVDESLLGRFHALADACEQQLSPSFAWAVFPLDEERTQWGDEAENPQIVLAGCGLVLAGHDICAHVRGACAVALLACTLGLPSERELRKHAAVSAADGLMYGAAASALVEACANTAESAVVAAAAQVGLHTNWRYSPGYGDLPLAVQPAFLRAVDATRRLGMSATSTCLLVPTKSVTAVVGLFDSPRAGADVRTACGTCQLRKSCQLRKQGRTCHGK